MNWRAKPRKIVAETRALLEENQLQAALMSIWTLVGARNKYIDDTAPFKTGQGPGAGETAWMKCCIISWRLCRILAVLLWPFLPGTAVKDLSPAWS